MIRKPIRLGAPLHLVIHLGMTGQLTIRHPATLSRRTRTFFSRSMMGANFATRTFGALGESCWSRNPCLPGLEAVRERRSSKLRWKNFAHDSGSGAHESKRCCSTREFCGEWAIFMPTTVSRADSSGANCRALTQTQLASLHRAVREIFTAAIRLRGSSISDYVDSNGNRGEFQARHRVYQREGKPCVRCKEKIRRVIVAGRSSHFCPRCQPAPGAQRSRCPAKKT